MPCAWLPLFIFLQSSLWLAGGLNRAGMPPLDLHLDSLCFPPWMSERKGRKRECCGDGTDTESAEGTESLRGCWNDVLSPNLCCSPTPESISVFFEKLSPPASTFEAFTRRVPKSGDRLRGVEQTPETSSRETLGEGERVHEEAMHRATEYVLHGINEEAQNANTSFLIVDAGAHLGDHSLWWARRFPAAEVRAFELHPETARKMRERVQQAEAELGSSHRMHVEAVGLSDRESDQIPLMVDPLNSMLCHEPPKNANAPKPKDAAFIASEEKGRVIRLDDYWRQNLGGRRVALLKIDVEGAEWSVLRGAEKMFLIAPPLYVHIDLHLHRAPLDELIFILTVLPGLGYEAYVESSFAVSVPGKVRGEGGGGSGGSGEGEGVDESKREASDVRSGGEQVNLLLPDLLVPPSLSYGKYVSAETWMHVLLEDASFSLGQTDPLRGLSYLSAIFREVGKGRGQTIPMLFAHSDAFVERTNKAMRSPLLQRNP
uniref:Methyltransferase FkbM domain-containing protein n=1 Tax=Chromera velia CCMP2878 TaxID=1169474 RepID=A0A0G4HMC1_9ALVE|eukprot:Cvel_29039.t1-p1 / transcript=Cvel_29039.t1 / gene=Cvel_29039 / organism=Chromera_velia_CCMP2878 / gene_product=hypothetical protein / transcript_product=hypothetical protein / location=Cvel_scaffold3914:5019-6476(-) / protein_length=486 / sequence_SO=supercontig / SO=protein_coding / is_pseudo=false